jgi:transcriptional regulator with XRE-family HTH domain
VTWRKSIFGPRQSATPDHLERVAFSQQLLGCCHLPCIGLRICDATTMAKGDEDPRKRWKREMGIRLRKELKRIDLSQADLTRRLGNVTKQLVNHWLSGVSEITVWDLKRLAALGVNPTYAMLGEIAAASGLKLRLPEDVIPYPTTDQVLRIAGGDLDPAAITRMRPVYEPLVNGLAIDTIDAAMAPLLPAGKSTIIIDRDRAPADDEVGAVVLRATAELLIRRVKGRRGKKFVLQPDNALFQAREIDDRHDPVILGVMISWAVTGSR